MAVETERKFLVCGDYMPFVHKSMHIAQGYICTDPDRTVRVRVRDGKGFITIKGRSSSDGVSRFEWEKEIPLRDAGELLGLCAGSVLEKTRHLVEFRGHTFEVDEFLGDNSGLVIAELELGSPDETFESPEWLGKEVTGDRRYYNSFLSSHPFRTWEKE